MLENRQALRDYYYQVKACTTWCVKMGQSAILQTPEYLSRATMRLPMNLRVRWYEHIDGRSGRSTLLEFGKWLCKRVDTLFNPLEDFICEEWNKKQKSTRPSSSLKLHPLATTTELPTKVPRDSSNVLDFKQARVQFRSPVKRKEVCCLPRQTPYCLLSCFQVQALARKEKNCMGKRTSLQLPESKSPS